MSKINKLITNKPVTLTEEEVTNLSKTLSAVQTAGGGGGGGGRVYYGDGTTVSVNQIDGIISLTTDATEKLNTPVPTKVSDLTDYEDYQTVDKMSAYLTTAQYNTDSVKFATKTELETTAATIMGLIPSTAGLASEAWVTAQGYLTQVPDTYYLKTETSGKDELSAAFNDILKYNVTGAAGIEITTATDNGTTTFGISMTAEPVVTDTNLSGYNGIAAAPDGAKSGWWNIGLTQDQLNTINGKLDSSDFTTYTGTTAPNTYLTKTSADTLYQPTGNYVTTADVLTGTSNTLTGIKIDSTNYTIPTTDLSDYYTKTQVDSTFASASQLNSYLTTAQYQTDSAAYAKKIDLEGFVTSSNVTTQDTDYVMTTTGWKVLTLPGGGMTQVIHDTTLTGQGNADDSKLGVAWSALSGNTITSALSANVANFYYDTVKGEQVNISTAINDLLDNSLTTAGIMPDNGISGNYNSQAQQFELGLTQTAYNAVTSVSSKVDKPDTTQAALNDKYLIYSTLTGEGQPTGWVDMQNKVYSKTEADGTFVATANIDTTTLSGDGKSVSTKLGVKTDVIATKDYVNSSFLPLTGGTVSGKTTISASDFFALEIQRNNQTGTGTIGINGANGMSLKITDGNNNTQLNIAPNATMDKRFSIGDSPYSPAAYFIPAVTATTTAGLTDDGILHIIVEN